MGTLFYHSFAFGCAASERGLRRIFPSSVGHRPTRQTPQLPPYPTVAFPPSTTTGTSLRPPTRPSISVNEAGSFRTFRYSTVAPAFS